MDIEVCGRGGVHGRGAEPAAAVAQTPIGWVCAVSRGGRLTKTCLPAPTRRAALAACGVGEDAMRGDSLLAALAADLRRYFAGGRVDLGRYPVDLAGIPPFQGRALLAARRIPYGQVRTYGWVAARAGRPRAARAAGGAMSRNPLPLVIPCHRVVAAGARLGGFGGGLNIKRALLGLEGIDCDERRVLGGRAR